MGLNYSLSTAVYSYRQHLIQGKWSCDLSVYPSCFTSPLHPPAELWSHPQHVMRMGNSLIMTLVYHAMFGNLLL